MHPKSNKYRTIIPARTYEQITCTLLGKIFRGDLATGEKVPTERRLAETFAVNRATVREALRYLENLQLITIRQGDGAYVKNFLESGNLETAKAMLGVDEAMRFEVLEAILEVRRINSPEVAYAAALKRSADHLQRLEEAVFHRKDLPVIERDRDIHHIIGLASGNIIQILMTNFCESFFYDFGELYFRRQRNIERSQKFHQDIYHAIHNQNAGVAREIMRDVLLYAEGAIYAAIELSTSSGGTKETLSG
jgi:GntR family transcriptional repressor for pyruvate dehydrogenase complex